jgi:hypothetical protein
LCRTARLNAGKPPGEWWKVQPTPSPPVSKWEARESTPAVNSDSDC